MIQIDKKVGLWAVLSFIVTLATAWGTLRSEVSAQSIRIKEISDIANISHTKVQLHEVSSARLSEKSSAIEDKLNRLITSVDKIANKLDKIK